MGLQQTVMKGAMAINVGIFRATSGRVLGSMKGQPILLLTTTGRSSGRARTTPLMDIEVDGIHHVIASAGGADSDPGWFRNVQRDPAVKVEPRGAAAFAAHAVVLEGPARDAVYEVAKQRMDNFADYEQGTERVIPVVRLDRA